MKINKQRIAGFTLIEALITISIAAILATLAMPSFTQMLENNRISAASNEFLTTMMYARSEAVKRSIAVTICTSANGTSCSTSLDDYAKGWLVFTDCNEDGLLTTAATACDLDGDGTNDPDLLLRVNGPTLQVSVTSGQAPDSFTYLFSGRSQSASFNIGPDASTTTKTISVATTGRVRLQ